jgi:hypothetical protein
VVFILAIMEIEAWFLAEHTHLQKLNPCVTPATVKSWFGFDPACDNMELRDMPALDMSRTYFIGGAQYRKDRDTLQKTVDYLDYARLYLRAKSSYFPELYLDLADQYPDLGLLVSTISDFIK